MFSVHVNEIPEARVDVYCSDINFLIMETFRTTQVARSLYMMVTSALKGVDSGPRKLATILPPSASPLFSPPLNFVKPLKQFSK